MHRAREDSRSNLGIQSVLNRRSSSMEIANRGSYLPPHRRSNSTERDKSLGKPAFKSTPKKPSFGNSISTISRGSSLQRASSISKKGPIKDPRPLTDRAYQKECINKLIEYLEENNFPYSLAPNSLLLPTKKDFEMIFRFLYSVWDQKYEVQKIEEEVPKIMKSLSYPFAVTKSALVSITRMSWPQLLGVIMWLVDLNKSCSTISVENYLISEEFDSDMKGNVLTYICDSYEGGAIDNREDIKVFTQLIHQKYHSEIDFEKLREENQILQKMIEDELEDQRQHQLRIKKNEKLEEDMKIYQDHIEKMNDHFNKKTVTFNSLKEKNDAKEQELDDLKNETIRLEAIYKTQGFDGEQAQNFYQTQKETLSKKLIQKRELVKQEEKKYWDLEIEYANLSDKAQTTVVEFQRKWDELRKLLNNLLANILTTTEVPATKKLIREYNFNLPNETFHLHYLNDMRPVLTMAKNYIEDYIKKIKNIIIFQEQQIQQIHLSISNREVQTEVEIAKLKQKERDMNLKMQNYTNTLEELKKMSNDVEKKTANIHKENKQLQERLDNINKTKEELKKKIKLKENDLMLNETKGAQTLRNIENMIKKSLKKCESAMNSLGNAIDEHMKFVKENPLPN